MEVVLRGLRFECDIETRQGWECTRGFDTVYCDGYGKTVQDCSEYWYPSELRINEIVTIGRQTYICDSAPFYYVGCVSYRGGRPPSNFLFPDIWCDTLAVSRSCTDYNPDEH